MTSAAIVIIVIIFFFLTKEVGEGSTILMGQLSSQSRSDSSWQQQRAQNALCAFSLERKGQAE